MNHLKRNPEILISKIDPIKRNYSYTFIDNLLENDIPIQLYYNYLLSIDEYKLKNIWNFIISKWNIMKYELKNDEEFINSDYNNDNDYHQIHTELTDIKLNVLLNEFINMNKLKSLFVVNCIQNYIYPL